MSIVLTEPRLIRIRIYLQAFLALAILLVSGRALSQDPVWDGNTVVMVSERLADGVYAYYQDDAELKAPNGLPIATSGGFIVGERGVLVIDTLLNERLANQVMNLVKEVTDQPIRYVLNTSYHGDHSYGNMYFPATTTIIQHENTKAYINEHFAEDTAFMIANFGAGRGIEEIVPTTGDILVPSGGRISLDLGGRIVQIIDFGFAQSGGDLLVWEPAAKVLWTGNPVIAIGPSLPWLLDGHFLETLETLQRVYDFLPADARIVPGHGPVRDREDMQWHIDYLTTIKTHVEEAVSQGLSLEETVASVTVPGYRGYALFDWVHPQMNVPAAHEDLSN